MIKHFKVKSKLLEGGDTQIQGENKHDNRADTQIHRQARDRHTDTQTGKWTDTQIHRQTLDTDTQTREQIHRQGSRFKDKGADIQTREQIQRQGSRYTDKAGSRYNKQQTEKLRNQLHFLADNIKIMDNQIFRKI